MAILRQLVAVNPDGDFVRRPATLDELMFVGSEGEVRRILDALVAARLVVVSGEAERQVRVELAHEAIIRSWWRFRDHLEQVSQFLRLRTRLSVAAKEWWAHDRAHGLLYSDDALRLLQSGGQLQRHRNELSQLELEFVAFSERAVRRRQMLSRAAVTCLTLLTLAMTISLGLAMHQRDLAEKAQERALREAALAKVANLGAASAISPDGRRMLQIDAAGSLRIVDLETGRDVGRIAEGYGGITTAIFSPEGRWLAVGTLSNQTSVYDSASLQKLMELQGHAGAVRRLAFSPDGRLVASGSDDATVRVWSLAETSLVSIIRADTAIVGLAFSPDGNRLIVSSQNGELYIADPKTGQIIRR
jgi:hypothetical protein